MNWYPIPGFPGYVINDEKVCISPHGSKLSVIGKRKDAYQLMENGRRHEIKIDCVFSAAIHQTPIEFVNNSVPPKRVIHSRVCHDCGKPTSDYRCPKCLRKWRIKHGVAESGREDLSFDVLYG